MVIRSDSNRWRSPRSGRSRRTVGVTMLVMGAIMLAACGGNDPSSTDDVATVPPDSEVATATTVATEDTTTASTAPVFTNPPATTNPEVVPVSGGTLIVGIEGESSGYNPHLDPWGNPGHNVAKAIFDSLAAFDAEGKAVPYLAESITGNADATVWTIVLRPASCSTTASL